MNRFIVLLALLVGFSLPAESQYRRTATHYIQFGTVPSDASLFGNSTLYNLGDTLVWERANARIKLLLAGATEAQALIYDSTLGLWKPGAGGGGGASALNALTNSTGNGSLSLGTYSQTFTSGATAANSPTWDFVGSSAAHTGYLLRLYTSSGSSTTKPLGLFVRGTTNGVHMTATGALTSVGTGTIDANRWKGQATFDKASQHAMTVYKDQYAAFTAAVSVASSAIGANALSVYNGAVGSLSIGIAGEANEGTGVWGESSLGYGVLGKSVYGQGGTFGSANGPMASFFYGPSSTTRITFYTDRLEPESGMDLGTAEKPFDSLFVNTFNDGSIHEGTTLFLANDSAFVYGLTGVDSNWNVHANFIDYSAVTGTLFGKAYNDGHIEITCNASPLEGKRIAYTVRRRTQP